MRKIVQVSVVPEGDSVYAVLIALADDGTLWGMPLKGKVWTQLPNLPEPVTDAKVASLFV